MKNKIFFLSIMLLMITLACSLTSTPVPEISTPPVENIPITFTPIPTFTAAAPVEPTATPSLNDNLTVTSMAFDDAVAAPPFTSKVTLPALQWQSGNDPRLQAFNELLYRTAQNEADRFKSDVLASATTPPIAFGSSFEVNYTLIGQQGGIWSFKFDNSYYFDGAAHPGSYSITVNYDLENGRALNLPDLFIPGSNYLQIISNYCKAEILTRDAAFESFIGGADPHPENYARWNLSNEGLTITFDEYQVAPYAAGPQKVVIPFAALQGITDPNGAISLFEQ